MLLKDITIIITTFNSYDKIKNCLKSINNKCKVINIENSSNQNYKRKIEGEFKNVKCILTNDNLGYGAGNNIGLKKVTTKYAFILNPDTIISKVTFNLINRIIKAHPNFALIGSSVSGKENFKNLKKKKLIIQEVENVKGHAMILNLKQFRNIGFFDENFFFFFEEIDLCLRLKKNNKKIFFCPNLNVKHLGGKSHKNKFNFKMELSRNWHWMWSTYYFYKKHYGIKKAIIQIFPKLINSNLKFIFYLVILDKNKMLVHWHRISGIVNAILNKRAWFRPKI